MIGQLIAAAGRGQTASPEARERIYATVRARWEAQTRDAPSATQDDPAALAHESPLGTGHEAARRRPRPRATSTRARARFSRWSAGAVGLAATVAAVALTLVLLQSNDPVVGTATRLAEIARVDGTVELIRGSETGRRGVAAAGDLIEAGDTLRTEAGGRVALRTEDGLLLRLNVSTEIELVGADTVDLIAGTIYVDAGSGIAGQALEINTPLGSVEHLGTQYEVQYDDSTLRVRVREGRVAWRGDSRETTGVAGEQFQIDSEGVESRGSVRPDDASWDWAVAIATLPAADEYRLGEVLEWVARERGLTLSFSNASIRQRVSGVVLVGLDGLNPLETLDVIERTSDLRAEIRETRLVITD